MSYRILVIDASAALHAAASEEGFAGYSAATLVAPALLWSECTSVQPVRRGEPARLELGWARTYDAEYVALARMLAAPLLTRDARLVRGASRVLTSVNPDPPVPPRPAG